MRKMLTIGAVAFILLGTGNDVLAAGCAAPADIIAVKTAAVQQKLMVAALSCNAAQLYNSFVTVYQKELQASDRALQNFFRRLNGRTGSADYHAFKTHLANASSMQSIADIRTYCDNAKAAFDAALAAAKPNLAAFIAGQSTSADTAFAPCRGRAEVKTAQAGAAAEPAAEVVAANAPPGDVPVPVWRPGDMLLALRLQTY